MPASSPTRGHFSGARPSSVPAVRERDFNRAHSAKSFTTSSRGNLDFTQVQGNAMNVYVRVRPFCDRELSLPGANNSTVRIDVENPCMITILDPNKDFRPRETFSFSRCFWSVLEHSTSSSKAPEKIRDCIDTFLLNNRPNNISSPRVRSAQSFSQGNNAIASSRGRNTDSTAGVFEGAGSNPVLVTLNNITQAQYSSQESVYNEVGRPILENTFEGYNGCVFAYGQTGSGKTFTMLGYAPKAADFHTGRCRQSYLTFGTEDECENSKMSLPAISSPRFRRVSAFSSACSQLENTAHTQSPKMVPSTGSQIPLDALNMTHLDPNELQGIIPRISTDLFKGLREYRERDQSQSYRVEVEYYEIYNEKVYDLIRSTKDADLKIRHHPVTGPYVEGLAARVVANEEQIAAIIRKGSIERHTAATKINDWSSRSHAILTINVLQLFLDENDNSCKKKSKLNLVDLAGSERTGAVGAEGKQFREGTKINLSLTILGRVIDCLADLSQSKTLSVPVPYRDSNLTWLLMDSLGGNSKTSMIATISPHCVNFEEMRQTIRYASRARQIVNKAVINEDPQVRQIRLLTAEVDRLKKVIREAGQNEFSRDDLIELQRRNNMLEKLTEHKDKAIVELRVELENHGITLRAQESAPVNASGATKRQRGSEPSTGHQRNSGTSSQGDNTLLIKTQSSDARSDVDAFLNQTADNRFLGPISQSELVELHNRIKTLTREMERLRNIDSKKKHFLERFIFPRMKWISDIIIQTMRQKEDDILRQVSYLISTQNVTSGKNVRRLQKKHREEIEQMRAQHFNEMEELHGISKSRIRESVEECNEQFQHLIEKHMEKLIFVEKRMKVYKEFYDTAQKQIESEKENMRLSHEDQLKRERARFHDELQSLRNKIGPGVNARQRSGATIKKIQEDHDRAMARLQEELDCALRKNYQEVSQLKQSLANESMRRESELLEKDRLRRQVEQEANDLRRELHKCQTDGNRAEQTQQNEIQKLSQEHEKLVAVCNALLSDWDKNPVGVETAVSHIRALLHSHDYMKFRARLRDQAMFERKDYTAELEALEERQRRDTKLLRDIVQKLKQNQEENRASLQRFEQDVMKHLATANKPRGMIDGKTTPSNLSSNTKSMATSKFNSTTSSSEQQFTPAKKAFSRKTSAK